MFDILVENQTDRSELRLIQQSEGIRMVRKYRDKRGFARVAGSSKNFNLCFEKRPKKHPGSTPHIIPVDHLDRRQAPSSFPSLSMAILLQG